MDQNSIRFTVPFSTPIDQKLFGYEFNFRLIEPNSHYSSYELVMVSKSNPLYLYAELLMVAFNARTNKAVQCQVDDDTSFPFTWDLGFLQLCDASKDFCTIFATPECILKTQVKTNAETSQTLRTFYTEDYNLPIAMRANFNVQSASDFRILVKEKTIYVHKFVLLQSAVLTAMLETQMTEAAGNTMEISDFDYDTVYELFKYLYLGESEVIDSVKSLVDLYAIFDKYDVEGPKEDIQQVLPALFKPETIAEDLVAIEPYPELCEIGINWIAENWKEIKGHEDWLALMETGDHLQAMLKIMALL